MFSVLLATPKLYAQSIYWLCAITVGSLIVPALLTWASTHRKATRIIVMLTLAVLISGGIAWADAICCSQCDPWWAQFYICWPSA